MRWQKGAAAAVLLAVPRVRRFVRLRATIDSIAADLNYGLLEKDARELALALTSVGRDYASLYPCTHWTSPSGREERGEQMDWSMGVT